MNHFTNFTNRVGSKQYGKFYSCHRTISINNQMGATGFSLQQNNEWMWSWNVISFIHIVKATLHNRGDFRVFGFKYK